MQLWLQVVDISESGSQSQSPMKTLIFRAAHNLGQIAARVQGKGYGTATVLHEVAALRRLLTFTPAVVLDVGANIGNWTSAAREAFPSASFHLFEPSRRNAALLESRFGIHRNVTIHNFALSNLPGELDLHADVEGSGMGSLVNRDIRHLGRTFDFSERVKVDTLAQVVARLELSAVDVMKVDVEGHELKVFEGADSAFWSSIKAIQFEFGGCNIDSRTYFRDFWYLFSEQRFKIYRITPFGIQHIKKYNEADEHFVTTNFLCVKNGT